MGTPLVPAVRVRAVVIVPHAEGAVVAVVLAGVRTRHLFWWEAGRTHAVPLDLGVGLANGVGHDGDGVRFWWCLLWWNAAGEIRQCVERLWV